MTAARPRTRCFAPSLVLAIAFSASVPAPAPASEVAPLAWVDGTMITTEDLDRLLATQKRPAPGAPVRLAPDGLLERLIQNRLLEEEGYRIGANEEPGVKDQVVEFRLHRGVIALLDSVSADVTALDPAPLDSLLDQENTMWRVAHIVLADEAAGRKLLDSLSAGVAFEGLAERHSSDTTSAKQGGDLGWAREDLYIPEFRAALTGLGKGGVAGPVKTAKGWHLLRLADARTETVGQSDAMRRQLREAAMRDRVMKRVRSFVDSLRVKYGVVVEDSLVASLDYGSADAAVQAALKTDSTAVATFPWRVIRVRDLTKKIRFQHFHGIEGKPDAPQIRDGILDEWVAEQVLRQEAVDRGLDRLSEIEKGALALEREALREHVGNLILGARWEPSAEEIAAYWAGHPETFTPPARFQADGVLFADEAAARAFRVQVDAGSKLRWLAERTPGIADAKPALFADWVAPADVGLAPDDVAPGRTIGPFAAQGAWAVATVTQRESVTPVPLDRCRDKVAAAMKRERNHQVFTQALERLRAAGKVRIEDGATSTVEARLAAWSGQGSAPAPGPAGEAGW